MRRATMSMTDRTRKGLPFFDVTLALLMLFALSLSLSKSASNILLVIAVLVLAVRAARSPESRSHLAALLNQPLLLSLGLYIGVALLGVVYTERMADGFGIVNKMVGLILVYFITALLLDGETWKQAGPEAVGRILLAFVAGILVLDGIAFLTYLGVVGDRKFSLPVWPMHVHHIWFANLNAIGFYVSSLMLLFPQMQRPGRARYLFASFLPIALLSMLFSLSRTAWLGFAVTLVIASYFLTRRKGQYYLVFGLMAAAGILSYYLSDIVHNRIDLIFRDIRLFFSGQGETNVGERFLMWKAVFKMFLTNPLFGVGTGDYVVTMQRYIASGEFPSYLRYFNQPHNMYFFALATNGLLGLGVLLYLFIRILSFSRLLLASEGYGRFLGLFAGMVTVHFMVGGLTDSFLNIQMLRYTFGFVMGLCVRSSVRRLFVQDNPTNPL
jgi:O-antigen ligase